MTGWPRRKLSEVLRIQNGFAFDSKQFTTDGGTPLIRIRDLKNGLSTETNFDGPYDPRYIVRTGDFLIGMDGEFGCFEWRGPEALLNQRVCKLTDFNRGIEPRFLFYGINRYLKEIEDVTTFTTVKHLSSKQIADIEFPVPPLEQQRRIVAVLDEAFAAIGAATVNAEKNLANAGEMFEAVLSRSMDGGTRGWDRKALGTLGRTVTGSTPKTGDSSNFGDFIPFIKPGDFNPDGTLDYENEGLSETGASSPRLIARGSALMVCIGATIGKSGYAERDITANQQVNALIPSSAVSGKFIYYQFLTAGFQKAVRQQSGQATLPIISKSKWNELPIWLPPHEEQLLIVAELDSLLVERLQLEELTLRKLELLAGLKQSLLHRAFSCELTERAPLAA